MAIVYNTEESLRERVAKCLEDDFKHQAIESAQETFFTKRAALVDQMPDWNGLRSQAAHIRSHVARNLDYYVKQFAEAAQRNGSIVHFAPDGADALEIALDICEQSGAQVAVKSKSMMTEEVGLNDFLEEHRIKVIETDCAEHILQTAHDKPSHIVVPALHFDRQAIAELYHQTCGYEGTEDPEEITRFLRRILREEFLKADIGIRGCNFAVANTGSVTLVTNEGNGRMIDTFPKTQIIFVGIDRIVPDLTSLDVMMTLLPRSAVGAKMTAYFSVDTGTCKSSEGDGPTSVHIILMDNGRSKLLNSEFESMMRCIRCGACLNICPVYRHITGHGYGSIYPGPMGIVLSGVLAGYDQIGSMASACTLCGACSDHCPVEIPLHDLIREHRINIVEEGRRPRAESFIFKQLEHFWKSPAFYNTALKAGRPVMRALAQNGESLDQKSTWIPVLKNWTGTRDFPALAPEQFRDWFEKHKAEQATASSHEPAHEEKLTSSPNGASRSEETDVLPDAQGGKYDA